MLVPGLKAILNRVPIFPKLILLKMDERMALVEKLKVKLAKHILKFEKVNNVQIIQPSIQQGYNHCSFASLSKQLDYQLRLQYATAQIPTQLPQNTCLFDHEKWRIDLEEKFPDKSRWKLAELLEQAKTVGAPLWNGKYHIVQEHACFYFDIEKEKPDVLIRGYLNFCPVVGVLKVKEDYEPDGSDVYLGIKPDKEDIIIDDMGNERVEKFYHAVVLLDYMEVDDMLYVIYQNSDGDPTKSLRGRGISLVRSDLIVELFYGASLSPVHPSAVLQSLHQIGRLQFDIERVVPILEQTDICIRVGSKLREAVETHLSRSEWEDADRSLENIITTISEYKEHYFDLSHFVRRFGDVEKAVTVSSLEVVNLLKSSTDFMSFCDGMKNFSQDKRKELQKLRK